MTMMNPPIAVTPLRAIENVFRGTGYATEGNALRVLNRHATLIGPDATRFVAVQDSRFFPVVVYNERHRLNIPALCARGITIVS